MKPLILTALALSLGTACLGVLPARADWALAFGQGDGKHWAFGSSWNKDGVAEARRRARENCDTHGPNCKVVLDGTGGCVALAVGIDDNAWHAKQSKSRREAAQWALDECVKSSSGDCEVRETFCEE